MATVSRSHATIRQAWCWAIEAALQLYRDSATWRKLIDNGMRADFSWQRQGKLYELVYERLLAQPVAQGG